MKPSDQDLRQRLHALSSNQRLALIEQLQSLKKESLTPAKGSQQLVAYVVPRVGEKIDAAAIKAAVKAKLPNYMVPAAVVPLSDLPLNANGKVDVNALPAPSRAVSPSASATAPTTAVEKTLATIWQAVLGLPALSVHDNFFELGGDSILSIQIVSRAREAGLHLAPNQLFELPTVAELATAVNLAPAVTATQSVVTGEVPLTPIQRWFFEEGMSVPQHWHQAMLFEVPSQVALARVKEAIARLWHHHDALRMRFTANTHASNSWQQFNADTRQPPNWVEHNLAGLDLAQQRQAVAEHGQCLHESTLLSQGNLFNAIYFTRDAHQPNWLLLSVHHLVVDVVSWQILHDDLRRLLLPAQPTRLPEKTTALKAWAEQLVAQANARKSELGYWLAQKEAPSAKLPQDIACDALPTDAFSTEETARTLTVSLSAEETTALIQQVPAVYGTQINDVLLSGVGTSLLEWANETSAEEKEHLCIELESYGRGESGADVDLSRTVGWFTTTYPLRLELLHGSEAWGELLKSVKEQLRATPAGGIGYGLLRYCADDATRQALSALSPAEVLFNYLGQQTVDSGVQNDVRSLNNFDLGNLRSPKNQRSYALEINAWVAGSQLHFSWTYDSQRYSADTIFTVAQSCLRSLTEIITHCLTSERGGFTPSDFPDATFDQSSLDGFIAHLPASIQNNIDSIYPLAPLQQAFLWNSLQTSARSGLLHVRGTLQGQLDLARLKQAWYQVIESHAALRSSVHWEGVQQPLQLAVKRVSLPWQVLDWRDEDDTDAQMEAFLESDRRQSFHLSQAPITRLTLVRTGELTYELIWTCHHLMLDGWSGGVVINQVLHHYKALQQNKSFSPAPVAVTYQDYIRWRNQQSTTAAQQFWTAYLKDFCFESSVSSWLKTGETAALQNTAVSTSVRHTLEQNSTPFLRTYRLTFNTLIQATWALLLHSRSGQLDLTFGATVSGRQADLPGVDSIVGLLINVLPVRVGISPKETVIAWLQTLQQQQAETSRYAYASTGEIQSWCTGNTPLFESLLVIENYPVENRDKRVERKANSGENHALCIQNLRSGIVSTYDLTLIVQPGDFPTLIAESSTANRETLLALLHEFESLLGKVMESAELRLQQILPAADVAAALRIEQAKASAKSSGTAAVKNIQDWPRNPLELDLLNLWQTVLGRSSLNINDNFFDIGGNSLLALQLFNQMQRQFDCSLPLATLFRAPSVRQFAALLEKDQEQSVANWSSLVPIRTSGSRLPLFFHGGSADALTWARFAHLLGEDQPFYALQRPDLDGSDIVHHTAESLAAACIQEMKRVQPEGPYVIGGHCFGGAIAFEIAQQLSAGKDSIAALILVDSYCPNAVSHTALNGFQSQLQLALFALRKAYYYHGGKNLTQLPKKIKKRLLRASMSTDMPAQVSISVAEQGRSPDYQDRYTRAQQANAIANDLYQPRPYDGVVQVFRAQTQILDWHYGKAMGWQTMVNNTAPVTTIPGLFGNLFNQRSAPLLADKVKAHLATLSSPSENLGSF